MTNLSEYFFLRPSFEKFLLEPGPNKKILIGEHDRKYRDAVLNALEEDAAAGEGHKSVIFGDFGRGKTHEAKNIEWEIERRKVPIVACYVKCHEYRAKEPFTSLFSLCLNELGVQRVNDLATEYERQVRQNKAAPIRDILGSDELATAFKALHNPNLDTVRQALQWLGGVSDVETTAIGSGLSDRLTLSREFAAVMQGLAHIFRHVEKKVIVFFIDEAERLSLVTHTDTYWSWVGCLRSLTELSGVGFIFYVSARSKDVIPNQLTWDEVQSRIGMQNYRELLDPGPEALRQWVIELFETVVRKGPVPAAHATALADDPSIPEGLQAIVGDDADALVAYPFDPDALDHFINDCVNQDLANRPREVLKRIQNAAKRAMRLERKTIDVEILQGLSGDV